MFEDPGAFGGFAVASTSWVWLRKQILTIAACWLATLGTLMMGMSVWQSVHIEGAGFKAIVAELERINENISDVQATNVYSTMAAQTGRVANAFSRALDHGLIEEAWVVSKDDATNKLKRNGYSERDINGIFMAIGASTGASVSEIMLMIERDSGREALKQAGYPNSRADQIINLLTHAESAVPILVRSGPG